ncbi:MAG: hypothetical protein EBS31_08810 [Burkholderiaceae bacterium]|nr:hypothetical protein [Burkholderiaceae bacterium]
MGTRGLTKVVDRNGVTKVAQYGQWDHYPSGQGVNVLNFLLEEPKRVHKLELALDKCEFVSEDVSEILYAEYSNKYPDNEEMDRFTMVMPAFSRDTGSDILKVVYYSAGKVLLTDSSDFENDDLFCEGVYEINYQTNKFISKYGDVVAEFPLNNLPEETDYLLAFAKQEVNA